MTTCACGCGQNTTNGATFRHGHNRRGTKRSPETLAKVRSTWADRHDEWSASIRAGANKPESKAAYSKAKKGIPLTPEHRKRIGIANAGQPKSEAHRRHIAEAGRINDVTFDVEGRAWVYAPTHPEANKAGRVRRARLTGERWKVGRPLTKTEVPHHINFDVTDDHPDNIMVLSRRAHTALHHRLRSLGIEDHFRDWLSKAEREATSTIDYLEVYW